MDWADLTGAGISVQQEAEYSIKAGITGALVIPGGEGQSLTASLLPEIHIALLRASDIEMTLTIGMHGPGELHVFVVT